MLEKYKIESRIMEIDAVIVEQEKIINQTNANLLALTGAKNELIRLLAVLQEVKQDEKQEHVTSPDDQG